MVISRYAAYVTITFESADLTVTYPKSGKCYATSRNHIHVKEYLIRPSITIKSKNFWKGSFGVQGCYTGWQVEGIGSASAYIER